MELPPLPADPYRMTESSPEKAQAREEDLSFQREILAYLPVWIRYRGLKQKHIANGLGISEGNFSRYLSGETRMSAGLLRKIAFLLDCHVGDLLKAPPGDGLAPLIEETLAEIERVGPERWRRILDAAKDLKGKDEA